MQMSFRWSVIALALLAAGIGCGVNPDGSATGLAQVFPGGAALGSTVAVPIAYDNGPGAEAVRRDVEVWLADANNPSGNRAQAVVRAVFQVGEPASSLAAANRGFPHLATTALVDLPASGISLAPPAAALLEVWIEGALLTTLPIEIVADGGTPTEFWQDLEEDLEPVTQVRIGPVMAQAGGPGFEPAWDVGAIEFDLDYFGTCIRQPRAYAVARANSALAVLGPPTGTPGNFLFNTVKTAVVAPDGLDLAAAPFLQVAFLVRILQQGGLSCGSPVDAADFNIRNLFVVDVDGNPLIDRRGSSPDDSLDYFALGFVDPTGPGSGS